MTTLGELCGSTINNPIFDRVRKQFKDGENIEVDLSKVATLPKSRMFNELAKNRGKKKPHSSANYVRREGKMKNS